MKHFVVQFCRDYHYEWLDFKTFSRVADAHRSFKAAVRVSEKHWRIVRRVLVEDEIVYKRGDFSE